MEEENSREYDRSLHVELYRDAAWVRGDGGEGQEEGGEAIAGGEGLTVT